MSRVFHRRGKELVNIDEETASVGVGPVSLDVEMARRHGWGEKAIVRAFMAIRSLSLKESGIARRTHPELYKDVDGVTIYEGP